MREVAQLLVRFALGLGGRGNTVPICRCCVVVMRHHTCAGCAFAVCDMPISMSVCGLCELLPSLRCHRIVSRALEGRDSFLVMPEKESAVRHHGHARCTPSDVKTVRDAHAALDAAQSSDADGCREDASEQFAGAHGTVKLHELAAANIDGRASSLFLDSDALQA
jgi:hypothetical protein